MYSLSDSHVGYSRTALTELLASDECTFNRAERRQANRLLNMNDWRYERRMRAFAANAGVAMFDAFDEGVSSTPEGFGAFIDIVQNWINFFIENQDKIMAIINFIAKLIPMIAILFAGQGPDVGIVLGLLCIVAQQTLFG